MNLRRIIKGIGIVYMKGSLDHQLKNRIKTLIIENCDLDIDVADIDDEVPLLDNPSLVALDSIDMLQISIAIQNAFGVVIRDSKEMRRVLKSINSFADHLQPG